MARLAKLKRPLLWGCACALIAASTSAAAVAPVESTGGAKGVTATSATLTGTVNPEGQATTYYFQYGTSPTSYGSTTPASPADAGSGTKNVPVSAPAGSLAANTTYHYRLVATNGSGTTTGADHAFKTTPAPPAPGAPVVATGGAKAVTSTSATLTGTVNPGGQATTYHFQYGTTIMYGRTTPSPAASAGSGTKNVPVSAPAGPLAANTTYHYRLVATNGSGTTTGADHAFKTANPGKNSPAVKIAAAPNPIVFGQLTTVSGSVHGPGAAHTSVALQRSGSATGPFVTLATTTTGPKGTYSFPARGFSSNTWLRTVANGVNSPLLLVHVRFHVTLFVSNTHPVRGQLIRFHGRVAPRHNGMRVQLQRLGADRRWHTISRPRLHSTSGNASTYSVRRRARRGGLYRVIAGPDRTHSRGFSRAIRVRLR
jgi:hypothetical protein